jgi:hypothetical protein
VGGAAAALITSAWELAVSTRGVSLDSDCRTRAATRNCCRRGSGTSERQRVCLSDSIHHLCARRPQLVFFCCCRAQQAGGTDTRGRHYTRTAVFVCELSSMGCVGAGALCVERSHSVCVAGCGCASHSCVSTHHCAMALDLEALVSSLEHRHAACPVLCEAQGSTVLPVPCRKQVLCVQIPSNAAVCVCVCHGLRAVCGTGVACHDLHTAGGAQVALEPRSFCGCRPSGALVVCSPVVMSSACAPVCAPTDGRGQAALRVRVPHAR